MKFIQAIIQEKGPDDFRAFFFVKDSKRRSWELRGYGKDVLSATQDGITKMNMPESEWSSFGYFDSDNIG